jgi:hypothetical protein
VSVAALLIATAIAVPVAISSAGTGFPIPATAAARLRTMALTVAAENGDTKPDWIIAVPTTYAKSMILVDGTNEPGNPTSTSTSC